MSRVITKSLDTGVEVVRTSNNGVEKITVNSPYYVEAIPNYIGQLTDLFKSFNDA